jgi:hypothetical protein
MSMRYNTQVFSQITKNDWGLAVAYLDEALCYKFEGRGFDSR